MRKIFLTVAAALAVVTLAAGSAQAVDMKGKWGPGVSFENLPLDVKFGISPKSSIFVGLGFEDSDIEGMDTNFGLGGGFEYALFGSDDFNFNLQPGIRFFSGDDDYIQVPLLLAAEVWMNDRFSVQMSHGITFTSFSDDDETEFDEGSSRIDTEAASVTAFRFRFYVK